MAQLSLDITDDFENQITAQAKRENKSVSAFVLDAVRTKIEAVTWSPAFLKLLEPGLNDSFPDAIDYLPPIPNFGCK
jgi:uncharacterized protein (DUF1778 family)